MATTSSRSGKPSCIPRQVVMRVVSRFSKFFTIGLLTFGLVGWFSLLPLHRPTSPQFSLESLLHSLSPKAAIAQRFEVEGIWRLVYEALPDLPLENHYVSRSSGEVVVDNTLVGRLIRYHVYVRGRPPNFRLDWKLTLGDYLGVNEPISATGYPGADVLRINPLEGDIIAVRSLNRSQREALVQTLVEIFNTGLTPSASFSESESPDMDSPDLDLDSPDSAIPSTPVAPGSEPAFREPRPGDAELLLP